MITLRTGALVLLLALTASHAEAGTRVYKSVDKDGNVIFTDVPPAHDAGAPLEINEPNAFNSDARQRQRPTSVPQQTFGEAEDPIAEVSPAAYESLSITYPENDAAIRENAGNVTISIQLSPALGEGHELEILLDGVVAASGGQSKFDLTNVDRGTHIVNARVIDETGAELISATPTTFHMLRYSALQTTRSAR